MRETMNRILRTTRAYITRGFYKFCNYMDEQSRAQGRAFFEAREAREKQFSTCGYHLSTINPADFRNLLEDMIEKYYRK
jgi:hypothetical protein